MTPEDFIRESNRIERISRDPTEAEIEEYCRFMKLNFVGIEDLKDFVSIYQPEARLRVREGMNVYISSYNPPQGGSGIRSRLITLLKAFNEHKHSPFELHLAYENLHPFTDCNGRSGRMLWMWQMQFAPLGFLHTFYYQALAAPSSRATEGKKK